ncbi:MAG: GNAT family N-acetyltransferase [Chloroflexota bacterium]|nr:GNAT family N-acetyltransferase [Chloroflexota bacterium]
MNFRPVDPADIEACADVFYAADDELNTKRGLPVMPRNRVALTRMFSHIQATDPGRAWLAERDGRVLGFAMSAQREELVFLAFLFIEPEEQSRGLGRELLERSMANATKTAVCILSIQPISAALYAKYGMVPRVPIYQIGGRPKKPLPELPAGLSVGPLEVAQAAALDRAVTGFAREQDHVAWQSWERKLFGLFEGKRVVGYGYAQAAGRLSPVVVKRRELLLPLVSELMRQVETLEDWIINVPGPAAEVFSTLLNAGMQLQGPPAIFCAVEDHGIDHSRYLPSTFALP